MKTLLTPKFIDGVKPALKRIEYGDTRSPNLALFVTPKGAKSWVWRGRVDGKMKVITLGPYPTHSLADARDWADGVTIGRDEKTDIVEKIETDLAREEWLAKLTCQMVFELYMEHDEESAERWKIEKRRMWTNDIKPKIGHKLATKIGHDDLMAIIRAKHATAPMSAIHLKNILSAVFKWSVSGGRDLTKLTVNPAADIVKLGKMKKRSRFLDQYEIGLFFKALPLTKSVMAEPTLFILYTGVRREEGFNAPWSEFNLETGEWLISEERAKNGQELLLPLPPTLVEMLKARKKLTGNHTYVWPSSRGDRPMTGFSKWVKLLHEKMQWLATKDGKTVAKFSLHDLRRTLSTGMNGLRDERKRRVVGKDTIERVLNHRIGGVEGVYDRNDYKEDKAEALLQWAMYLQSVRTLFEVDKIAPPLLQLPAPTVEFETA